MHWVGWGSVMKTAPGHTVHSERTSLVSWSPASEQLVVQNVNSLSCCFKANLFFECSGFPYI